MELYIRLENGAPVEHPMIGENFRQAYPQIDTNNLPPEFARFERIQPPPLGTYETNQRVQYEKGEDGIYRDVWYCDLMTEEEKKNKQDQVKAEWNNYYPSWIFNEEFCSFGPPVPYPEDGKPYQWDEETVSWKEIVLEQT